MELQLRNNWKFIKPLSKNKTAHEQNNIPEPCKRQPHKMVKHTQGQ